MHPRRVAVGTHVREHDDLRGREFRPVVQPPCSAWRWKKRRISRAFRSPGYNARTILTRERSRVLKHTWRARDASYRYLGRSKPRVKITPGTLREPGARRGRDRLINPAGVKSKLIHCGYFAEANAALRFTSLSPVKRPPSALVRRRIKRM